MADQRTKSGMESAAEDEIALKVSDNDASSRLDAKKCDDLDDLLDDALDDFDKLSAHPSAPHAIPSSTDPAALGASCSTFPSTSCSDDQKSQDALFNEIFSQADPATLETFLSSLMSGDATKLDEQLKSFDSATRVDLGAGPAHGNVAETIQQTLGSLLQNTQQLQQDDNITEEEIMQMMSSMGMDGGDMPGEGDFMPMMQTMMRDLLSKDVLYPSLKEITAQYPSWLANNKNKIDDEQYTKYEQQFQLMSTITKEFEGEETTDSDDIKRRRFERILDMMQKMQEFGHPPKEIVGDTPYGFELDADGLPKLPTGMLPNPEQCCIM